MQSKWKTMENVPLSSLSVLEIESRLKTERINKEDINIGANVE